MKKISIAYRLKPEGLTELEGGYQVTMPADKPTFNREEVLAMIPDYEVLIPNFSFFTDREMMDRGVKLELISNPKKQSTRPHFSRQAKGNMARETAL